MTAVIELWTFDLTRPAGDSCLSEHERARAARLVMPDVRRRFVTARVRLREVLAQITGRPAADLAFGTGEFGKPHLVGIHNPPAFNLSHSDDLALVAVSDVPVGVDVERIRPLASMAQMAEMAFTEDERAAVDGGLTGFFRLWTRKEAVTKADGRGFRLVKMFSAVDGNAPVIVDGRQFALCDIDIGEGFTASAAAVDERGQGVTVRMM